jgi:hypothetical protein
VARATVLKCDICDAWDSVETPVRNVMVAGPRYDLCGECRADLMIRCGTDAALAYKYQAMVDERIGVRGNMPALGAAKDWVSGRWVAPTDLDVPGNGNTSDAETSALESLEPLLVKVSPNPDVVDAQEPEMETEAAKTVPQKGTRRK